MLRSRHGWTNWRGGFFRMGRNVEIKARVTDLEGLGRRVRALATNGPTVLDQVDTFFNCPDGRLKLRRLSSSRAELIHYHRPDTPGPRESRYSIVPVTDPDGMQEMLSAAYGVRIEVTKRRTLFLIGQTRVHLDEVEQLGSFVELEVVLECDQSEKQGRVIADELILKLRIPTEALVDRAYADLLEGGTGTVI